MIFDGLSKIKMSLILWIKRKILCKMNTGIKQLFWHPMRKVYFFQNKVFLLIEFLIISSV